MSYDDVETNKGKQIGLAMMIALAFMIFAVILWIIKKKGFEIMGI